MRRPTLRGREGQSLLGTLLVCVLGGLLAVSTVFAADSTLPPPPRPQQAGERDAGGPDARTIGALSTDDGEVASELDLLEDLDMLQKLDAFDPGAKAPVH